MLFRSPRLVLTDASVLFARLRAIADPAEIALSVKAASIAESSLAAARGDGIGAIVASVEAKARTMGAEEIYIAVAPDLARDHRFFRLEGDIAAGESFALRATVAYKGSWIRLTRTCCDASIAQAAAARFAAMVAQLPSGDGFAGTASWLVEGCRMSQPLEALLGSRMEVAAPLARGALVSVQANVPIDGRAVLMAAPALVGARGEPASLLVAPLFR